MIDNHNGPAANGKTLVSVTKYQLLNIVYTLYSTDYIVSLAKEMISTTNDSGRSLLSLTNEWVGRLTIKPRCENAQPFGH